MHNEGNVFKIKSIIMVTSIATSLELHKSVLKQNRRSYVFGIKFEVTEDQHYVIT